MTIQEQINSLYRMHTYIHKVRGDICSSNEDCNTCILFEEDEEKASSCKVFKNLLVSTLKIAQESDKRYANG